MSESIEITVATESDQIIQISIEAASTVEQLKRNVEFQTTLLVKDQELTFDGKPLDNSKFLRDYNIKNGDLVFVFKKVLQQPQRQQPQGQQPQPQQQFRQPAGAGGMNSHIFEIFSSPKSITDYYSNNPEELTHLINANPQLADAILSQNQKVLEALVADVQKQKRLQELATKDPFSLEYQQYLEEQIQKQNIEQNMNHAMEHTPEVFASVYMLYVDCSINGHPIKAFVDTGAQQSIMSETCAKKCELMRIVDTRFHGIAKGVGTSKIIGRVHSTQLKLGGSFFSVSLSIIENQDIDFILGLDMLKRHQCLLDLGKGILNIGGESVPFLHEKDLKEILQKEQGGEEDPKVSTTTTTTTTSNNSNNNNQSVNTPSQPINKPAPTSTVQSPPPSQPKPAAATPTSQYATEEKIAQLMGLGCPRDRAINFLNRAFGDVERAAAFFFG
ncbi:hypothetical protein CYY_004971 [Polysphondylium violaceum]|uniref:DNA damage-inducible protein 1 n=1 Tax=Polysphondylium violaceum TaxID=133409 RepID=A0A8J4V4N2_9MYCE|nr:hypothetical protein CYY_004971 [Polysphondylium violaceum]